MPNLERVLVLARLLLGLPSDNSDVFVAVFSITLDALSGELPRGTLKQECLMRSEYLAFLARMHQPKSVL